MTCSIMHDDSWTVKKTITCHGNNDYKQEQVEQKNTLCTSCLQMKYWLNYSNYYKKIRWWKIAIKIQHFTHVSLILSLKYR